jgi:hypothetical protein
MLQDYSVRQLNNHEYRDWLLNKHYAKRLCSVSYAFGLIDLDQNVVGVITFGCPPNRLFNDGKCIFSNIKVKTMELNRLVLNSDTPKNSASFFIMKAINKLPKPLAIVSYADPNNHHHGYVYQATNWLYTGTSTPKYKYTFEDGSINDIRRDQDSTNMHTKFIKGNVVSKEEMLPTYRYIYIHADKRDKKNLVKDMRWDIEQYPKGLNKNYECIDIKMKAQLDLF